MTANNDITIRRRQPSDVPELAAILGRVHAQDGYPVEGVADPAAWIEPPRELAGWTALLSDRPIGHISLTEADPTDDAARLWVSLSGGDYADLAVPVRLFVDPHHRALGVGHALMRAAHEHGAALDKRIVFDVMLKDQQAIRLYEALGCHEIGRITHHHSDGLEEPAAVYVAP